MIFVGYRLLFSVAYSSKDQCVMNLNDASWHLLFCYTQIIYFPAGFEKKL
jgi:hypothetical protein